MKKKKIFFCKYTVNILYFHLTIYDCVKKSVKPSKTDTITLLLFNKIYSFIQLTFDKI